MIRATVSYEARRIRVTMKSLANLPQGLTPYESREFNLTITEAKSLLADLHWVIYHELGDGDIELHDDQGELR